MSPTALLVSPHPDDEVLGAGAAAVALRCRGWRVINLACGLGRAADHDRRRRELRAAARLLDIEADLVDPPASMSLEDDLTAAQAHVTSAVLGRLRAVDPEVVVAPSVHDGHHAHELCGRAARDAVQRLDGPRAVWWWRLWGQGGPPTLVVDCEAAMGVLRAALSAHAGELARNRYLDLLEADARADAIRAGEQVFGFGSPGLALTRARVYCETVWEGGRWRYGEPRVLGETATANPRRADAGAWLRSASPSATAG